MSVTLRLLCAAPQLARSGNARSPDLLQPPLPCVPLKGYELRR